MQKSVIIRIGSIKIQKYTNGSHAYFLEKTGSWINIPTELVEKIKTLEQ